MIPTLAIPGLIIFLAVFGSCYLMYKALKAQSDFVPTSRLATYHALLRLKDKMYAEQTANQATASQIHQNQAELNNRYTMFQYQLAEHEEKLGLPVDTKPVPEYTVLEPKGRKFR